MSKYTLEWTTDLTLRTGTTIIHSADTLASIRAKLRALQGGTYWQAVTPVIINGHKPYTVSRDYLKAYRVKLLALRKLEDGRTNYLFARYHPKV